MDARVEAQGLAQGGRQAGAERGAAQGDRPGARRPQVHVRMGARATPGMTSTRRPTNGPGLPPRPTSRALPSGQGPGSARPRSRRRAAAVGAAPAAARPHPSGALPAAPLSGRASRHCSSEPDLFSGLEEPVTRRRRGRPSPEAIVESLERELLRPGNPGGPRPHRSPAAPGLHRDRRVRAGSGPGMP